MIDAAARQGQDGLGYELVDGYVFQGTVVRYTVVPSSASGYSECTGRYVDFDGLSTKMRGELRSAMDKWEAVAGVQLVEVPYSDALTTGPNGQIDLAIAMANDEPGGTAALTVVADALRDLVAETNRECGTNDQVDGNDAIIVFDTYDLDTGYYETAAELRLFHNVALHELGHALGIDHSDLEGAVLSGNHPTGTTRYTLTDQYYQDLTWDDVQAARAVYGSPRPDPWLDNDYTYGPRVDYHEVEGTGAGEALVGTPGPDEIKAGAGNDRVWGLDARDVIYGMKGQDLLFGQEGDDWMAGGADADILLGGDGDDILKGDHGELRRISDGGPAPDWNPRHDGEDRIWGEAGNDQIRGDGGADFLSGGEGNDLIAGGSGQDYCDGGPGDDEIHGNGNPDARQAGNISQGRQHGFDATAGGDGGYDVLAGGAGADTLYGSRDGATFFGQDGADTFVCQGGRSWVMDFEAGTDRLWIAGPDSAVRTRQVGEHVEVSAADDSVVFLAQTREGQLDGVDWLA